MAKFLVIHPNMDIYGGGERVAHHILKTLVAHGQEVELLSYDFDPNRYAEIIGEKLPSEVAVHMLGQRIEAKAPFSVYKRRRKIIQAVRKFKDSAQYDYTFSTQTLSAFETELYNKAKANVAYVHFPEIHYDYAHSKRGAKAYLWLYKKWLEGGLKQLDLVFCNSQYTKAMTQRYWCKFGVGDPVVAYPPVENQFWSTKPLDKRAKRVVYVGRFIPKKRHEILKQLAAQFPAYEFASVGLLRDTEQRWFDGFSRDLPSNYALKPNLPEADLVALLVDSQIYLHLMEGEHFGIAPMEALASGCLTLVHNSGGSGELIPPEFRWNTVEDLKTKLAHLTAPNGTAAWERQSEQLRSNIAVLKPEVFQATIWSHVDALMQRSVNAI